MKTKKKWIYIKIGTFNYTSQKIKNILKPSIVRVIQYTTWNYSVIITFDCHKESIHFSGIYYEPSATYAVVLTKPVFTQHEGVGGVWWQCRGLQSGRLEYFQIAVVGGCTIVIIICDDVTKVMLIRPVYYTSWSGETVLYYYCYRKYITRNHRDGNISGFRLCAPIINYRR